MSYVGLFFAGAFLCNSIPHLCAGLLGMPFPSPFAKPCGVGDSAPLVNFCWGLFNVLVSGWLLSGHEVEFGASPQFGVVILGVIVLGATMSVRFGHVQATKGAYRART